MVFQGCFKEIFRVFTESFKAWIICLNTSITLHVIQRCHLCQKFIILHHFVKKKTFKSLKTNIQVSKSVRNRCEMFCTKLYKIRNGSLICFTRRQNIEPIWKTNQHVLISCLTTNFWQSKIFIKSFILIKTEQPINLGSETASYHHTNWFLYELIATIRISLGKLINDVEQPCSGKFWTVWLRRALKKPQHNTVE